MAGRVVGLASGLLNCGVSLAVALLVAKALTGSWTWGLIATAAVAVAYAFVVLGLVRWARSNPDAARRFGAAWGRARAAQSGGWERERKHPPRAPNRRP